MTRGCFIFTLSFGFHIDDAKCSLFLLFFIYLFHLESFYSLIHTLVFLGQDLGQVQVAHLRVEFSILGPLLHEEAEIRGQGLLWEVRVFLEGGTGHTEGQTSIHSLDTSSLTLCVPPPGNSP